MQQSRVNIFAAFRSTSHQGTTRAPRLLQENRGLKFDCARANYSVFCAQGSGHRDCWRDFHAILSYIVYLLQSPSRDFHVAISL